MAKSRSSRPKVARPRSQAARPRRPASGGRLASVLIELEHTTALCRRHTEELAIQFKRIAQLQAELDEVKKMLKVGA